MKIYRNDIPWAGPAGDPAVIEEDGTDAKRQHHGDVLLDQQQRQPLVAPDAAEDAGDLGNDGRLDALRRPQARAP